MWAPKGGKQKQQIGYPTTLAVCCLYFHSTALRCRRLHQSQPSRRSQSIRDRSNPPETNTHSKLHPHAYPIASLASPDGPGLQSTRPLSDLLCSRPQKHRPGAPADWFLGSVARNQSINPSRRNPKRLRTDLAPRPREPEERGHALLHEGGAKVGRRVPEASKSAAAAALNLGERRSDGGTGGKPKQRPLSHTYPQHPARVSLRRPGSPHTLHNRNPPSKVFACVAMCSDFDRWGPRRCGLLLLQAAAAEGERRAR